ncbi:MAG: SulP family inorganic anion transporter [candidate division Zixibacteria bacterium]|nr:SulP family inorganic anion transporter [candidate division Zixibacteria bacterium]
MNIHQNITAYLKGSALFDIKAGFITAIVALPLAIAFAIASGVPPIMGLYTAVIAGLLGSTFGGSKFSITGPTGAMTVIILATVNRFGIEGLLMAGLLAGLIQIAFGVAKVGTFVKYIPLPVVSGFTAGIGIIIFIGQIANGLGISIPAEEFIGHTVVDIVKEFHSVNLSAVIIVVGTILMLVFLPSMFKRIRPLKNLPPSLVPLSLSVAATMHLGWILPEVGDVPSGLPAFNLLSFNFDLARQVLPAALTIALLGSIEALLCAVVCDGMTNTKHDSDKELKSQGIANAILPWFGGIPCTAAIARSAVNVREGAKTKGAGIIHALFLLSFMLVFASIVSHIPKAFLAGILMFVSFKMINIDEIKTIMRISRQDTIILFVTLGLTVLTDLVFAVQIGMFFAIFLLFVRLVNTSDIRALEEYDPTDTISATLNAHPLLKDKMAVYTINGPFFFGTMSIFEKKVNEHMHMARPIILIRMKHVPFIDATGQTRLKAFVRERKGRGIYVLFSGLQIRVEEQLLASKEFQSLVPTEHIFERSVQAIEFAEENLLQKVPV